MKKLATLFTRSLQEFKQVKTVTVCAMMGAVALVLGSLSVEIIPSVRIGFSGIPNEFVAWLFGPVVQRHHGYPEIPGETHQRLFPGADHGHHAGRVHLRLLLLRPPHAPVAGIGGKIHGGVDLQRDPQYLLPVHSSGKGILAVASAQNSAQRDHVAHRFPDIFLSGQIHGNSGRASAIWLKARPGKGAKKRREALKS